ncbi:MAG: hypothetical protein ACFFD7_13075, partial [Candidatus Thorarchaeota archaeon]
RNGLAPLSTFAMVTAPGVVTHSCTWVYVVQGILVTYFLLLAYRILKRRRQRINLIFSLFFLSIISAFILNMIYAAIPPAPPQINETIILILYLCANFFVIFGPIFILIVHMIILESTIIYSVKRQNRFIILYGIVLLSAMLTLVILGIRFDEPDNPFLGIDLTPAVGKIPQWGLVFCISMLSIMSVFSIIPIIRTSLKIYSSFETEALKKKWLYYFVGSFGLIIMFYFMLIDNLYLGDVFRTITLILGVSVVFWGYLMYYGIGFKLKE